MNETVFVNNCHIHDNGVDGVAMVSGRFHTVGGNSVIENNGSNGVYIDDAVMSANVVNSAIQSNDFTGVLLSGTGHDVQSCLILSNGQSEGLNDHFGGVVCGGFPGAAFSCRVQTCTLAGNQPYGAKLVLGNDNRVNENEIYLNITEGIRVISSPQQSPPTLSHFVVDEVHDEIVVQANISTAANQTVEVEFFVAYDDGTIVTEEGAVFCDDTSVQANSSGQGSVLFSFGRNVVFQAEAISPSPIAFEIDHEDRLVATATQTSDDAGTSEFSAASHPTLTGDYNLDGNVDTIDYVIWRNNEGATNAVYTQGDGNFDGTVNQADYTIWQSHFGLTP
jgi:hypothetical protein